MTSLVAKGKKFKTDISLKSTADFSFLIKRYSLPDLFAGKLAAILQRETLEAEQLMPRFKGRDYYDLFWFLEKKVVPNWPYLLEITSFNSPEDVTNALELKLHQAIKRKRMLKKDLLPFFADKNFVERFTDNIKVLLDQTSLLKKLNL
ncbi:MAG: nucleotidyl transferase AbiEii/AbiGii toxin family protein [Patescibacteria group bacterium]